MHITVVGSGYVGLVAGACFAELGHEVILVDNDPVKLSALQRGEVPIHEQHLPELLDRHRGKRLSFSDNTSEAVRLSQAVFVAVGTPPMHSGEADLSYVECVARDIAGAVCDYKVIVGKSTVPVYTSQWVRKVMLLNGAPHGCFDVASNPEFLREGTAVVDFLYPDRIVIGCDNARTAKVLEDIYKPLTDGSYYQNPNRIVGPARYEPPAPIIVTSTRSAELIKHASNAFLAMKISFINAVANICESVGADVEQVRTGIGTDARIGHRFLYPGIGYGGSCFPKDLSAFRAVARENGYEFRLLDEVMHINEDQRQRFLRKVRTALWTLKGKQVGVLGLAFKDGTDDIRESPAIAIIESLLAEGCRVKTYDPAAMERAAEVLPSASVTFVDSPYEAASGADALLVLTEWQEFKSIDLSRIRKELRYPIVIDGRNLFSRSDMQKHGFIYLSIGRPDVVPQEEEQKFRTAGHLGEI
ncbi:MAG TPA: UDP-glucose/GDP-mannose dehydrogenase family protein [Terriglobales bacterium]|nr:UDP-glucose/GDP-mannose dehydrogenase family protein [Terriglobales bacterium]